MKGNIPLENLDDRTWQELVDQAKTLALQYAPQWTDQGPSDLGVTLIELFAWLVEGMQYRLNRAPERSYAAMLNLVGVTRDPARPAVTMLTFKPIIPSMTPEPPRIPAGTTVSTVATERQPAITFQTDDGLSVLPSTLSFAFIRPAGGVIQDLTTNLIRSPLSGQVLPMKSSDALELLLGFDIPLTTAFDLNVRIAGPQPAATTNWLKLQWSFSVNGAPALKTAAPTEVVDGTNNLQQSGTIHFQALNGWTKRALKDVSGVAFDPNDARASISAAWLSVVVTAPPATGAVTSNYRINLAHVLFNSVSATNLITVDDEILLRPSDGQPWQEFQLNYAPLYKMPGVRDPYTHVRISVDEVQPRDATVNHPYPVVDDFPTGDKAATRCCRLDPVTGTILFGSNDGTPQSTGVGLIPPKNSMIRASYRAVGGGAGGNVAPGTLVVFSPPAGIQSVTNPAAGRGGADQESAEDAKRRAPDLLRIRSRAVTVSDYEFLALEASTLVKKAKALGANASLDGRGGFGRAPGKTTVLIVPDYPKDNAQPTPDADLINEVRAYLDDRRVVTTSLAVGAPRFLPILVTGAVSLFPAAQATPAFVTQLQADLNATATGYLHPLFGGPDAEGWDIGEDLFVAGLFARLQDVIGDAGFISSLSTAPAPEAMRVAGDGNLAKALSSAVGVGLLDFELICSATTHAFAVTPL